jgi:hypothetical protein
MSQKYYVVHVSNCYFLSTPKEEIIPIPTRPPTGRKISETSEPELTGDGSKFSDDDESSQDVPRDIGGTLEIIVPPDITNNIKRNEVINHAAADKISVMATRYQEILEEINRAKRPICNEEELEMNILRIREIDESLANTMEKIQKTQQIEDDEFSHEFDNLMTGNLNRN